MHIERTDTTDSTSLQLRRRILAGGITAPTALIALEQTGGIGQFGRRWFSPRGGLWFSVALPSPHQPGSRALSDMVSGDATRSALGLRLGHACRDALAQFLAGVQNPAEVSLKPPNDLLLVTAQHPHGAKVAGLLTEILTSPPPAATWILVGIGINTNLPIEHLPADLPYPATSIFAETRATIDNDALMHAMLEAIATATDSPKPAPTLGNAPLT